jgi:Rhodopirellula transposase DDE domain
MLPEPTARVRAPGGGRKKLTESDPEPMSELNALVDPETRGDPMSPLVWTTNSTRNLAGALSAAVSARHSCHTRRSNGTERFSTRTRTRGWCSLCPLPADADVPRVAIVIRRAGETH